MIQINKNQKIKFLILAILLKRQITILRQLKEGKIPDVSNLATKTALAPVENTITDASSLVKKTNYNTKVT